MRALEQAIWLELERGGAVVDACCGADDDPFGGVVHNRLPDESVIDVMPAKWNGKRSCHRTERMTVMGSTRASRSDDKRHPTVICGRRSRRP